MSYYDEFKRVRNQIRKLDTPSLIFASTSKLHEVETKSVEEWQGFLPWRLLLLIKWGFEYGGSNYPLRNTDEGMLIKLVNLIHNFEGAETNPFLKEQNIVGLQKFLRTIAFQQFWLQKKLGSWVISRQRILFCSLAPDNPIRKTIEQSLNQTDIEIFLELSWLVWAWASKDPKNYLFRSAVLFQNMDYSERDAESFCSAISLSSADVKDYLTSRKQVIANPFLQLTEMSPFVRYPFLKVEDQYLVYSQQLLKETISNIFYDVMKSEGGSPLAEKFGSELEKYVDRSLSSLGIEYYVEKDLFRAFPGENVTDFLLPFSDFTLMIEVKAVEMRPIVKVNPKNEPLQRELQDSVIKGIVQGFSLANSMRQAKDSLNISERANFFLMIVTYKDLYLGAGDVAWDEFLGEAVEPMLLERNIDPNLIPREQIVFLSVEEFDQLVSILWQKAATMAEIFEEMLEANKNWETRKWMFSQHLDKFRQKNPKHPFLDDEFDVLAGKVEKKFTTKA